MGIVGGNPESGVRVDIARPALGGAPWRYEGEAATLRERFALSVEVSASGDVTVHLPPGAPSGLADKVRRVARAAWKHAHEDGAPPPRRIVRWRAGG